MYRKFLITTILILALHSTNGSAVTVEKLILSPRIPGLFKVNIEAVQNSRTNQTLVLWERHAGTPLQHSIWGKLLHVNGQPVGGEFLIINGPNAQRPRSIYNPDTNQFVLFFSNQIGFKFKL